MAELQSLSVPRSCELQAVLGCLTQSSNDFPTPDQLQNGLNCSLLELQTVCLQEFGAAASRKPQSLPSLLTAAAQTERQVSRSLCY